MNLNEVASGERIHVVFLGRRNAGKSSLVNAVAAQKVSVVSDVKGTTTDPVKKSMEILPLGAVVLVDTPGMDDEGDLGELRVERAKKSLSDADIAVLVADASEGISAEEEKILDVLREKKIPFVVAFNKSDLLAEKKSACGENEIFVSAKTNENIDELKNLLGKFAPKKSAKKILNGFVKKGDIVILVIPVDESAPKGRLILPQQETLREILDEGGIAFACQPGQLEKTLSVLRERPRLVITDSQAFAFVAEKVPREIPLTSFSILFARYKGNLDFLSAGAKKISALRDGDKILIAESCTHHRQCRDIGTVQLPAMVKNFSGKNVQFEFSSGAEFPSDLSEFSLVIHCGGCMITEQQMKARMEAAKNAGVSVVNYGTAMAYMNGIFSRCMEIFGGF